MASSLGGFHFSYRELLDTEGDTERADRCWAGPVGHVVCLCPHAHRKIMREAVSMSRLAGAFTWE